MPEPPLNLQAERSELEVLRRQLAEARETLDAICDGEVDAVVVRQGEANQVFTLEGAERPYRQFVEEMSQGAVTLGQGSMILYCNQRFSEMLQRGPQQVTGSLFDSHLAPASLGAWQRLLEQVGKGRATAELELRHLDGTGFPALIAASRANSAQGTHLCVVVSDLTEYKHFERLAAAEAALRASSAELEERVAQRTAQLEASNRELEAFSYSVAHDLRSPLRGIDGFSQVLLEDYQHQLDATARHYLVRIRKGTQRMGQLIEGLLKLSQLNRSLITPEPVDLSSLAGKVLEDCSRSDPGRRVATRVQPGMLLQADRQLLLVVLENLLGNAWKFTAASPAPRIEVFETAAPGGGRAFCIRDNGVGFEMKYGRKVFEVFERLHQDKDFEGTGIGLAIVQRIIQRLGGQVWAEGAPGTGASFFFTVG